jgi:hypothetical protein
MTPSPAFVLIPRFAELTGYSVKAVERKIERGQWLLGREWFKAPDGHRMMSIKGYEAWVARGRG